MTYETEPVEVTGTIIAKTPDAIMLDDDNVQVWIPLSQITSDTTDLEISETVTIEIPEWLATDRGLV